MTKKTEDQVIERLAVVENSIEDLKGSNEKIIDLLTQQASLTTEIKNIQNVCNIRRAEIDDIYSKQQKIELQINTIETEMNDNKETQKTKQWAVIAVFTALNAIITFSREITKWIKF